MNYKTQVQEPMKLSKHKKYVIEKEQIASLLTILQKQKYKTIGPTVRDGVVFHDEIHDINDLPIGFTDEHKPGSYRLQKRKDKAMFAYTVGPSTVKKYLFPPHLTILKTKKENGQITVIKGDTQPDKFAFFGIKPCELHAILVQDKIFIEGEYVDSYYQQQRNNLFIVTTNCTNVSESCFCASIGSGPEASIGFDLSLTELIDNKKPEYIIEAGSDAGINVLKKLDVTEPASDETINKFSDKIKEVKKQMKRSIDTSDVKELLLENLTHPYWDELAERCLSCSNCRMVCPTCFCSTIQDVTSLTGEENERVRKWDSCYSMEYSYIHGGSIRASIKSRHRQWMTHKLASWQDQFNTIGCVGCGRCIVWCPVGIDITAETEIIRNKVAVDTGTKV